MSNNLSEPINQEIEQQLNPSPQQPGMKENLQKVLLIILGIMLVILSVEGILLIVIKNKEKGLEVENQKKVEIAEEKITPVPAEIESSWEGEKTVLVKGKVTSFDINERKINIILKDNTTKTIEIDDRTIFIEMTKQKDTFLRGPKMIEATTFWKGLSENDEISCSCYEGSNLVAFIGYISYEVDN